MHDLFEELKRRRVFTASAAYIVVGWVIIEAASVLIPTLLLPEWSLRLVTVLVLLGFPIAVALSWIFDITTKGVERTSSVSDDAESEIQPLPSKKAAASVAVLPFETLSQEEDEQTFALGLSTEIHTMLANHNQLEVISRRALAGRSREEAESMIAQLGVRYVLSGSVLFSQGRARIIAELDDATIGTQIWSERFEEDMSAGFGLFTKISESVVAAFGVEHFRAELLTARQSDPTNLDAWQLVQKARARLLESDPKAFTDSKKWLEQAIEQAPEYAGAQATLSFAIAERVINASSENEKEDLKQAQDLIQKAVQSHPNDPYVLKMAGMVFTSTGDPSQAIATLDRAVDLTPFDFGAWGYLGWPLTARGRQDDLERAQDILARILEASPRHPGVGFWHHHQAVTYVCQGDLEMAKDAAIIATREGSGLAWAWLNLANIQMNLGEEMAAEQALTRALACNPKLTIERYVDRLNAMSEGEGFVRERSLGLQKLATKK